MRFRGRGSQRFFGMGLALLATLGGATGCQSTPDPGNELPFGYLDAPTQGQLVGREVEVRGWAVDDSRVEIVHLFVDGRYQASARLTVSRPDVVAAHPAHTASEQFQGWHALVDLGEQAGPHFILAQAVDDGGATRDIGVVEVTLVGRGDPERALP